MTGVDMSASAINVGRLRQLETHTNIQYEVTTAEAMAATHAGQYDVVTCLENAGTCSRPSIRGAGLRNPGQTGRQSLFLHLEP